MIFDTNNSNFNKDDIIDSIDKINDRIDGIEEKLDKIIIKLIQNEVL